MRAVSLSAIDEPRPRRYKKVRSLIGGHVLNAIGDI